jgi:hypothetical protein
MNATRQLHDLGQSLWLDNIACKLPTGGTRGRHNWMYRIAEKSEVLTHAGQA